MADDLIRAQALLDTRALEMAVRADALINQHLVECRDRYLALHGLIVKAPRRNSLSGR